MATKCIRDCGLAVETSDVKIVAATLWQETGTTTQGSSQCSVASPTRTTRTLGRPTFPVAAEAIGFDNLLLNLRGHGQHELQHLAHVIARVVPGLVHPHGVLRGRKRLDHLGQDHCESGRPRVGSPSTAGGKEAGNEPTESPCQLDTQSRCRGTRALI